MNAKNLKEFKSEALIKRGNRKKKKGGGAKEEEKSKTRTRPEGAERNKRAIKKEP